jgi:hypothetical protein
MVRLPIVYEVIQWSTGGRSLPALRVASSPRRSARKRNRRRKTWHQRNMPAVRALKTPKTNRQNGPRNPSGSKPGLYEATTGTTIGGAGHHIGSPPWSTGASISYRRQHHG